MSWISVQNLGPKQQGIFSSFFKLETSIQVGKTLVGERQPCKDMKKILPLLKAVAAPLDVFVSRKGTISKRPLDLL